MIRLTEKNIGAANCIMYISGLLMVAFVVMMSVVRQNNDPYRIMLGLPILSALVCAASFLFVVWSAGAKKQYAQEFGRELPKTNDEFVVVTPCMKHHLKTQAQKCAQVHAAKDAFMLAMEKMNLATDEETDANLAKLVELNEAVEAEDHAFSRKRQSAVRVGFIVPRDQLACITLR